MRDVWLFGIDEELLREELERSLVARERGQAVRMIYMLGRVRDRPTGHRLAKLVRHTTDALILHEALKALGRIGDRATSASVARLLREPSPVRDWAADALGRIGDRAALPALAATLHHEQNRDTKRKLIRAIYRIGGTEARAMNPTVWRDAGPFERLTICLARGLMVLREAWWVRVPAGLLRRMSARDWRYVAAGALFLGVPSAIVGNYWLAAMAFTVLAIAAWRTPSAPGPRR